MDPKISFESGAPYIWDRIRKKAVSLTKEEWVRQHLVHLLIEHLDYPRGLIRVEAGLKYYKKAKRSDIVVYDTSGEVFLLIECKSPETKLTSKTLHQLATYNKTLRSKHLAISNGMKHFCWKRDEKGETYAAVSNFPRYELSSKK
ncbi:MAG: type I restriction enzyme HsdR N-terminal domain-containing protein [Bacteroidota bacterium]